MPQVTIGQISDTHRNNFDALRFFFASLVILSHSYLLLTPDGNEIEPVSRVTYMKMNLGSLAVACFFGISGFLITQSWLKSPRVSDYLRKRVLRIYPGWTVAVLFCVFIIGPVLHNNHYLEFHDKGTYRFISQLLLYKNGYFNELPGIGIPNGSLWTIPFEFMCYLLVMALGLLGIFRKRNVILFFMVALVVFIDWPTRTLLSTFGPTVPSLHLPYLGWLRCLPLFMVYFLSGTVYYLFREHIPHSSWLFVVSVLLVGMTLLHAPLAHLFFVIIPTFGFYILFYLAFLPIGRLHDFAKHGDLSYGIYLYAYPIQRLLIAGQVRGYRLTHLTLFLLAWLLSCGVAILSWHLVERPFLKLKPGTSLSLRRKNTIAALMAGKSVGGSTEEVSQ